jgi:hypothetical protein
MTPLDAGELLAQVAAICVAAIVLGVGLGAIAGLTVRRRRSRERGFFHGDGGRRV